MADRTISAEAVITARDATGNVFQRVGDKALRLEKSLEKADRLSSRASRLDRLDAAGRKMDRIERSVVRAERGIGVLSRADMLGVGGGLLSGGMAGLGIAGGIGAVGAAGYVVGKSVSEYASAEQQFNRIAITAGATREEMRKLMYQAQDTSVAVALPFDRVAEGYDTLAAQGRSVPEILALMPAVARTAQAANASVEDVANAGGAVSTNMKIATGDIQKMFDVMVAGGNAGQFELKDMARYLPGISARAAAIGETGLPGLRRMVAALQVIRTQTGTAEEAQTALTNTLTKMWSTETQTKFKKFGIDLFKEMKKEMAGGKDALTAFLDISSKAVNGDLTRLPVLFSDDQFQTGVRALITSRDLLAKLTTELQSSGGAVDNGLNRALTTTQAHMDKLSASWERFLQRMGEKPGPVVTAVVDAAAATLDAAVQNTKNPVEAVATGDKSALTPAWYDARAVDYMHGFRSVPQSTDEAAVRQAHLNMQQRDAIYQSIADAEASLKDLNARRVEAQTTPNPMGTDYLDKGIAEIEAKRDRLKALLDEMDTANIKAIEAEKNAKNIAAGLDFYAPFFAQQSAGETAGKTGGNAFKVLPPATGPDGNPWANTVPTGDTLKGFGMSPGAITAELKGAADVNLNVKIEVSPTSSLIDAIEATRAAAIRASGPLRVTTNGAGSVGVGSPETE